MQPFFRAAVSISYQGRCALSGLADPSLLIASHIIPWSQSVERRADPRNGILLNARFDRAFDRGLFTLDDDLRVIIRPKLRQATDPSTLTYGLDPLAGRTIEAPSRFPPDGEAIRYRKASVFVRSTAKQPAPARLRQSEMFIGCDGLCSDPPRVRRLFGCALDGCKLDNRE